jgi:hypothetical protein
MGETFSTVAQISMYGAQDWMEEANQYLENGDLEQDGDGLKLDSMFCSSTRRRAVVLDATVCRQACAKEWWWQ